MFKVTTELCNSKFWPKLCLCMLSLEIIFGFQPFFINCTIVRQYRSDYNLVSIRADSICGWGGTSFSPENTALITFTCIIFSHHVFKRANNKCAHLTSLVHRPACAFVVTSDTIGRT